MNAVCRYRITFLPYSQQLQIVHSCANVYLLCSISYVQKTVQCCSSKYISNTVHTRERKKKRLVLHCCLNEVSLLMKKVSTINVMLSLIRKTFLYTFLYIYIDIPIIFHSIDVIEFAIALFFAKMVAHTFLFWLPYYVRYHRKMMHYSDHYYL